MNPRISTAAYLPRSMPSAFIPKSTLADVDEFLDSNNTYETDFPTWGPTPRPSPISDHNMFESIKLSPFPTYPTLDVVEQCSNGQSLNFLSSIDKLDCFVNHFGGKSTPTPQRPHSCFNLALSIISMFQLSPQTCGIASIYLNKYKTIPSESVEHKTSINKAIIGAITLIISCSCSLDEQLISILFLILFQVLASYTSATKEGDHILIENHNLIQSDNHSACHLGQGAESSARAQLILSELHHVVEVVDMLSTRFKEIKEYVDNTSNSEFDNIRKRSCHISLNIVAQLEVDLRRSLREVINEVLEMLLRF
ncbi:hypothetical protein B7463_g10087, partial [Scytalidium lignicola]